MKNLFSSTCYAAPTSLMIPFPATVYFRVVKHNTLSLLQSKQRNKQENIYELWYIILKHFMREIVLI